MDIKIYEKDYISKYKPNENFDYFFRDFLSKKNLILISDEESCNLITNNINFYNYFKSGVFIFSLFPLIFFNKITKLKEMKKSWKKFFLRTFLFLSPIYGSVMISEAKLYQDIFKKYEKYGERWINYKITGDLKDFNSNIKLIN